MGTKQDDTLWVEAVCDLPDNIFDHRWGNLPS
jgi:hypothetical protein